MEAGYREILDYLRGKRAVDFAAYRQGAIMRRLGTRLSATGSAGYPEYLDRLRQDPAETDALLSALTIKVSCFFRNPLVFEMLREVALPDIVEGCRGGTLRIWSAGCARGEEPYSLAIAVRDLAAKEEGIRSVFILGTDIDEKALDTACSARYPDDSLDEVKKKYLVRHFDPEGGFFRLKEEIRSMVVFGRHDIASGSAPAEGVFADYHLVLCRNVMIYFDRRTSQRVCTSLAGLVSSGGYLVLGEAESVPGALSGEFEELAPGTKIFRRRQRCPER